MASRRLITDFPAPRFLKLLPVALLSVLLLLGSGCGTETPPPGGSQFDVVAQIIDKNGRAVEQRFLENAF